MRVILTHEQADFDSIASLLAVQILDESAIPVLPRRLNRNVRAYLTLYKDELPFRESSDLRGESISNVTLVDTQSMMSIGGLKKTAQVHVIDHHFLSPDLPSAWTHQIEMIGANTTLLVEKIQDGGGNLDLIQATLLLLGIYEDTGSLTYASTTARDVHASAWLLEQGASLKIAVEYLYHPLSDQQQELYERLIANTESHQINGQVILISSASATNFTDEISTLAHKLRDLYDPAALFLLVGLDDHLQLVARSTSDTFDVSKVAAAFGGGGHTRAAAALIHDKSIAQVQEEILTLLQELIKPQKVVEEIMSRTPQLFNPSTTVAQAEESMRRFGHEGYPVLDDGQVIGLITRRAIDRALTHGLDNSQISEVMDVGTYLIRTTDSVHRLQQLMVESNWGQIPVVDPATNAIVGIVTRTDLLSNLVDREELADFQEIRTKLRESLPSSILGLLLLVSKEAERQNAALYVVGGFVRDLLLGFENADFDLVVEGDAILLAEGLSTSYGGRVSSHKRFGTAKWHIDKENQALRDAIDDQDHDGTSLPEAVDLVSARTEFYAHPTALPSVQRSSIKLDLHRRDFSINTLAIRLDGHHYGELLDHWGGGRDLKDRQIRVLHSLSFVDDPTRMLRAVRLEQRLGFEIEPRTLELLQAALSLMDRVSGERIRNEFSYIFQEVARDRIFRRLDQLHLLSAIHPAIYWDEKVETAFNTMDEFFPPREWQLETLESALAVYYALWMLESGEEEVDAFCKRLHFPTYESRVITDANHLSTKLADGCEGTQASAYVRTFEGIHEHALLAVYIGNSESQHCREAIDTYLRKWRFVRSTIRGEELRDLGLPPGPDYRRILGELRDAWLDHKVNSEKEERDLLRHLIQEVELE
jgi:tRNA nucleotidyltransferase (CCA-adding enzyme)